MAKAVQEVKDGTLKESEAAKNTIDSPWSLNGHHSGRVGAKTTLASAEELVLVNWIKEQAMMVQPLVKRQVSNAALKISLLHDYGKKFPTSGE